MGFTRGFHVWEIVWPSNQRGTHAVVGVATKNAPLHVAGYTSLIGYDAEGYGWNIGWLN
jgi:SPRY domain-containing SOCS box protein 1/4